MERAAHPTEKQRKYLADLISVNLKDVINPPRSRGEMSDLLSRVEANRYSTQARREIREQVAPAPQVDGALSELSERNVAIGRTQKQLRREVSASKRADFATRYGIQNASADPLDWPFWALIAGCAEWKVTPSIGTDYPYLGTSLQEAVQESTPPAPPAFVREVGVFYTETRLADATDDDAAPAAPGVTGAQLRKAVDEAVAEKLAKLADATKVTVQINDADMVEIDGLKHKAFDDVLELTVMRKPVMLIGPTGCGKSYLVEQVAEALDLPFYAINCSMGMSESKLTGLLLPSGEYIATDFIRAFEEGGVFLLDEIDAADPNVLLIMNTAIASGQMPLPLRKDAPVAQKHEDFTLVAAANTHGTGASRMFVGRNKLDDATLDRFRVGQMSLDYDRDLETQLVPDASWRERVWLIREKAADAELRRSISTRFLADGYDMISRAGWSPDKVIARLIEGWSADERSKVGL